MGDVANIDLKMLYFIGIFVILLILILVSFVLTSRRANRLEQGLDDALNRLQQSDQSLSKIRHSLELLSSAQADADDERSQNDEALQEIKAISKKLSKLSSDYDASIAAQNELRKELQQLKEQVEQQAFTAMPNAGAATVDQMRGNPYAHTYDDPTLRQGRGQSMLPPMGRQHGMGHTDPMGGAMNGMGGMSNNGLAMGGMGGMPNNLGGVGQNTLPSGMGGNGLNNAMGGYGAGDDSGVFMPPNSRDANQTYNPSEKSGLQELVNDGSKESLGTVKSSHQSQMGQRSTTIGFTPDDEGFRSNIGQNKDKNTEIKLPSMSVVADMAIDPIGMSQGKGSFKDGMGSRVVEVDPQNHALAQKLDASKALNSEQANAKAQKLAQEEKAKQGKKGKGRSKLDNVDPASKLSPTEEAVLAAVNSAVDEKALFGSNPSDYDDLDEDSTTPQDYERFAALDNFTNLYTNARKKQLAHEQQMQAGKAVDKLSADKDRDLPKSNSALQDLNAVENSLSSVVTEQGSTIDFGQDLHFGKQVKDNKDGLTDGARTEAVAKVVADEGKRNKRPLKEVMSPGVLQKATVVDMIYDEEYVRKQKDQKPFGINIATLDKAHTFIDAGVSLAEISAKTGLSEDELRLLYDVDEDGKVRNSGDMFKENSALSIMQGEDAANEGDADKESSLSKNSGKRKSLSSKGGKSNQDRKDANKERLKVEPNNPSAVLDKDERKEIESIMQDAKSMLHNDDDLDTDSPAKGKSEASLKRKSLSSNKNFDDNEDSSERHKQLIEQIKDDDFEQNLDAIDQFADSLIKENRKKDNKRKQDQNLKSSLKSGKGSSTPSKESENLSSSNGLNPLGAAVQSILHDDPHGKVEIAVHGGSKSNTSSSSQGPVSVIMPHDLDDPQLKTEEDSQQDPLNILDDFKQVKRPKSAGNSKFAGYATEPQQDPTGEGAENLAGNNADYRKDFNAGLDAALGDDDAVTLKSAKPRQPSRSNMAANAKAANTQDKGAASNNLNNAKNVAQNVLSTGLNKVSELANKALGTSGANNKGTTKSSLASNNRSAASRGSLASSADSSSRQVVKHYGKSQNPSSSRGIGSVSGVNRESYDQAFGTEKYARNAMATPSRNLGDGREGPEKITVDMALAQMGAAPELRNALESRQAKSSTSFSAVTSMNPGMSDVVDMAPMGIGSIEDEKLPDDPAELLSQVVNGGLQSLSSKLSDEQVNKLNKVHDELSFDSISSTPKIAAPPSDPSKIPVEPTKVKPGQHYANRKARNAYGMRH